MAERQLGLDLMPSVWMLTCPNRKCRFCAAVKFWDVMGACDGQVICPKCSTLVDIETGKESELCGKCDLCTS
jgi:hypothetical protein